MLTIGKLGRSADQLAYYEQQVARGIEDYFSGRGEAPGRWMGHGCGGIGLSGQIDRAAFMRAMAGCDPRTGERLRPDQSRTKLAAFDLTFSAPKSVSVLFAIADEQASAALVEAHERRSWRRWAMSSGRRAAPAAAGRDRGARPRADRGGGRRAVA